MANHQDRAAQVHQHHHPIPAVGTGQGGLHAVAAGALAENSSQPMAARVARHLREVALPAPNGHAVAQISHQRLADAVGTVREVISRQLRTLRTEGVIDTQPGRVIIVNEKLLDGIAAGPSPWR